MGSKCMTLRCYTFEGRKWTWDMVSKKDTSRRDKKEPTKTMKYVGVWCSMLLYGVIWCSMVLYGVVWCSLGLYIHSFWSSRVKSGGKRLITATNSRSYSSNCIKPGNKSSRFLGFVDLRSTLHRNFMVEDAAFLFLFLAIVKTFQSIVKCCLT